MTEKTTTRDAVASDIAAFYGRTAPQTLRARVLVRGDEVIGIAGYYVIKGHAVVFADNRDGVPKMTIWREALKYMKTLPLPALCNATETSGPFLKRLGWQFVGPTALGDLYRYEAKP